jgi:hypothetical protein
MTSRDPDETIRSWFAEGASRGPARGLEETLARLAVTPQPRRREVRLPVWLPLAATFALLVLAAAAFSAGFRISVPQPIATSPSSTPLPSTTGSCTLTVPVVGRNAIVVGSGFAPDTDVVLDIDRVHADHLHLDASAVPALHTDREGRFGFAARPYPEDLGVDHFVATAGCTATLDLTTVPEDLPPACPDPTAAAPGTIDGAAYRAAVTADHPSHWWRLDEAASSTAVDAAGNATGTYVGDPATYNHSPRSPLSDGGSAFLNWRPGDPTVGIQLPSPVVLHGDFTIEAWVYLCHYDDDGDVIVGSFDAQPAVDFGIGNLEVLNDLGTVITAKTRVSTSRWQHWVVTRQAGELRIYLDGVLDSTGGPWTGDMPIGMLGMDLRGNLLGFLDEVALYDRALPADRIASHARP